MGAAAGGWREQQSSGREQQGRPRGAAPLTLAQLRCGSLAGTALHSWQGTAAGSSASPGGVGMGVGEVGLSERERKKAAAARRRGGAACKARLCTPQSPRAPRPRTRLAAGDGGVDCEAAVKDKEAAVPALAAGRLLQVVLGGQGGGLGGRAVGSGVCWGAVC
jgi:hypothetical protein